MDNNELWSIVEKKLTERAGSFSKSTSYLEYYDDIIAFILKEVISLIDPSKITPEFQAKINILDSILQHASVNLNDISNPLEAYKVQGIIELKDINSELRQLYMNALLSDK